MAANSQPTLQPEYKRQTDTITVDDDPQTTPQPEDKQDTGTVAVEEMAANKQPIPEAQRPSRGPVDCIICHRPGMRQITLGHLQYHHRKGELLPEIATPTGEQLHAAYKLLAGIDERLPMQSYVRPLSPDELVLYRKDPEREKKLHIRDKVYCRECGLPAYKMTGGGGHLETWHPNLSSDEYSTRWPGAPLRCLDYSDRQSDYMIARVIENPEGKRQSGRDGYLKDPAAAIARANHWVAYNQEKARTISREHQRRRRKAKAEHVTAEELAKLTENPSSMSPRSVCLFPECGRVIKGYIDTHLQIHGQFWMQYQILHPGALRGPQGFGVQANHPSKGKLGSGKPGPSGDFSETQIKRAIELKADGQKSLSWAEIARIIDRTAWTKLGARNAGEKLRKAVKHYQKTLSTPLAKPHARN